MNNKVVKKLSDEYKSAYLRKTGLLFYLLAIFIVCMAMLERYEVLTGGSYIVVYILGGCVLAILGIYLKRKYMNI